MVPRRAKALRILLLLVNWPTTALIVAGFSTDAIATMTRIPFLRCTASSRTCNRFLFQRTTTSRAIGSIGQQFVGVASKHEYRKAVPSRLFSSPTTDHTFLPPDNEDDFDEDIMYAKSGYKRPMVNWYPGHIAKAERQLAETLRVVDVVVEVRDARAAQATSHPRVAEWCAGKPRIVVLTHADQVPTLTITQWKRSYEEFGAEKWDAQVNAQIVNQAQQNKRKRQNSNDNSKQNSNKAAVSPVHSVLFVNAKHGQGIFALTKEIYRAGAHVQERRRSRGLKERPLRVGMIGFPNVGKSALINRVLGRRRAKTANTPGITRTLQWIRVRTSEQSKKGKEFELLDSPGIIPANMEDQDAALVLAACNCIGDAAYDNQGVASYLCERIKTLILMQKGFACPDWRSKCQERYGFDPLEPQTNENDGQVRYLTGEDMLHRVAGAKCRGSPEDASRMILQDFRTGRMGHISLQLAPQHEDEQGQLEVVVKRGAAATQPLQQQQRLNAKEQRMERARAAVKRAQQEGLELPPIVTKEDHDDDKEEEEVGKGLFDGW